MSNGARSAMSWPVLVLCVVLLHTPARAEERMTFWNLTTSTLTALTLAPAGTSGFGANQCANDRDGAVEHDERLKLTGVMPGRYDVQLTTKQGRMCIVHGVELKAGGKYAFSLADSDLAECH